MIIYNPKIRPSYFSDSDKYSELKKLVLDAPVGFESGVGFDVQNEAEKGQISTHVHNRLNNELSKAGVHAKMRTRGLQIFIWKVKSEINS